MRSTITTVAEALEIDPALLRFAPELLADLDALGSDPEQIVEAIAALDLPPDAHVLDLGCGKGAVAIAVAAALGLRVTGVDAFAPFVEASRRAAAEADVGHLCRFEERDIRALPGTIAPARVAIYAALGDVLGPLDETMALLRALVEPGGVIVIADGFIREGGSADFPGFEGYGSRAETQRRLQAHGDVVERAWIEADDDDEDDEDEGALIHRRAEALAAAHPEFADALMAFARDQSAEYDYLADHLIGVVWVVRRADDR